MTPLRQRMIEDMQLRGFSARTQECYVAAVRQLARHFHRSPDQLTEEELRQYFLYLANEKKVARATATIALCGIKFFFQQTLRQDWTTLRFVRPAREKKLPVVLSREEVRRILSQVRIPVYRACLTTLYACGLRLLEGAHLQVADVDSARIRKVYVYHSCRNRHCPKCHGRQTERWLAKQRACLLPCQYYLLTFTLPSQLRRLAHWHQKKVYGLSKWPGDLPLSPQPQPADAPSNAARH